jgi:hypothetical protein
MKKEFKTLSEKIQDGEYFINGDVIHIKDVKEFIKVEEELIIDYILRELSDREFWEKRFALLGKELIDNHSPRDSPKYKVVEDKEPEENSSAVYCSSGSDNHNSSQSEKAFNTRVSGHEDKEPSDEPCASEKNDAVSRIDDGSDNHSHCLPTDSEAHAQKPAGAPRRDGEKESSQHCKASTDGSDDVCENCGGKKWMHDGRLCFKKKHNICDKFKKKDDVCEILCPICAMPMDFLEEWDSNLKMTECYKCGCMNCGAILEFKDYEQKFKKKDNEKSRKHFFVEDDIIAKENRK